MVDQLTVTVRQVKDQMSPPDRVISVELVEADTLDPKEITDFLHSHEVFTYGINDSKTIVNWGASWEIQEIIVTVGAMAEIINLLINLIRSKRGSNGLRAEEGVERAANFIRQNFQPKGQL